MTWTVSIYHKIVPKAFDACGINLYRGQCRPVPSHSVMIWKKREELTAHELASQLHQYEESLSSSLWACISTAEKLVQELKERECLFSHLYRAESQLLGVSILLKRAATR